MEAFGASPISGASLVSTPEGGLSEYTLVVRQQPEYARVTLGKDKDKKPVDPPPIVQLKVPASRDPQQHFLQNPFYFMMCSLVKANENDDKTPPPNALLGTLVSSIHRLKDLDNTDGGFFIFGELSVKVEGHFRLLFTLYEIKNMESTNLASITSKPFHVHGTKTFPGMAESTFLTRSFSDQGVRLRLRKDSRNMSTRKRNHAMANWSRSVHSQREAAQQSRGGGPSRTGPSNIRSQPYDESVSPASRTRASYPPQAPGFFDQSGGYPQAANQGYEEAYDQAAEAESSVKRAQVYQGQASHVYEQVPYRHAADVASTMPPMAATQGYPASAAHMVSQMPYGQQRMAPIQYTHRTLPPPQPAQPSMSGAMMHPGMEAQVQQGSPTGANPLWGQPGFYRPDSAPHGGSFTG